MRKLLKRILLGVGILLVAISVGFVGWASHPLGPGPSAFAALQPDSAVSVETIHGWTVFRPIEKEVHAGFIFYPGGRVDYRSYAPILKSIAQNGFLVVLVPMPLSMAFFTPDKADEVLAAFPEIQHWALGGHSLGGAMAAHYCFTHPEKIQALILWGSYPANTDSLANQKLVVLSIFGSEDGQVTKIEASSTLLPTKTNWIKIDGGSHAQFGDYGLQPGDGQARISPQQQWDQVTTASVAILLKISGE
ncbi:MAG: alpha/beta hydrolase [Chloroflexi bacterium]|nr:alpha/beta hydrolase [Chloroflexota bacterium]